MQSLHQCCSPSGLQGDLQRIMLALYMRKKNKKQNRLGSSSNHVLPKYNYIIARNISFFSPKNPIRTYQAGLLTQLQRCKHLPGFHQWYLFATPLHSSGPVGDSHSVPFSPAHYTQTPVSSQYSVFVDIIAQHLKNVKPKLFKPSINATFEKPYASRPCNGLPHSVSPNCIKSCVGSHI